MIRFHYSNEKRPKDRSWAYPGGNEDSARFANFLERLAARLANILVDDAEAEIAPLSSVLIRQGRFLGLAPRRLGTPDGLAEALFSPPPDRRLPDDPGDSPEAKWNTRQKDAIRLRPEFRSLLRNRLGCFKGKMGETLFAIDVTRLKPEPTDEGMEVLKKRLDNQAILKKQPDDQSIYRDMKEHVTNMAPVRLFALSKLIAERQLKFGDACREAFGKSFLKQDFVASMKSLLTELEGGAAWPGPSFEKSLLRKGIETFRTSPLIEELGRIERLRESGPERSLDVTLDCLGGADFTILSQVRNFVTDISKFLAAAEQKVANEISLANAANPERDAAELVAVLDRMLSTLDDLVTEEVSA